MAHAVASLTNLADLVLRLGAVERATRHPNGAPETVTTHTVMVALLAFSLAELGGVLAPDALSLALSYALVHDLPEALAGDTDTSLALDAEVRAEKDAREEEARETVYTLLGPSPVSAALAAISDPSPGPRRGQVCRQRYVPQTEIVDYVWAVDKIAPVRALVKELGGVDAVRAAFAGARAGADTPTGELEALERATAPVLRAGVAVYADVVDPEGAV